MKLVRLSVGYPVTVLVAVILVVLFGGIALTRLPLQMVPTVDRPVITVKTPYPGAAPLEVEQQVTDRIEEQLNFVEGLLEITSSSSEGTSEITMKFDWGVDKDIARLDVSEKLGTVQGLPDDVEESIIQATSSDQENPIAWIILKTSQPINEIRPEVKDDIKVALERPEGVAGSLFFGGEEREVHVVVDDRALAARGLSVAQVRTALRLENRNVKGGTLDEGKRRNFVRTLGEFENLEDIRNVIVSRNQGDRVLLRDIAEVRFAYAKKEFILRQKGEPSIAFGILRRTGANVVEVMERVRAVVEDVNRIYAPSDIQLEIVYDETDYIYEAQSLVTTNLLIGGGLAIVVLLLFLRNGRSTIIVAFCIPISLVATFMVLHALDRTLNIVTLAGLAFAVGMVVDNAIVVLENVFRHLEMGKPRWQAAYDGTVEVWGAVLAATLTTLAVFVPVVFVQEEAGQLFRDLALAIATAVAISLIVAMTVIPMLSARLLSANTDRERGLARFPALRGLHAMGGAFGRAITGLNAWLLGGLVRRLVLTIGLTAISLLLIVWLVPEADYLPTGNRNMAMWFVQTQPGLNVDRADAILTQFESRIVPQPEVNHFFGVGGSSFFFMGALIKDEHSDLTEMKRIVGKFNGLSQGIPGVRQVFVTQPSIFASRGGFLGGTNLEIVIRGPDLALLEGTAGMMQGMVFEQIGKGALGGGINFAFSSYSPGNPELQIVVDRERATRQGLRATEIGDLVETLVEGTKAGVFRERGRELDVVVKGGGLSVTRSQDLENVYFPGPGGAAIPLRDVAAVVPATGPTKVEHTDLDRSVKVTVNLSGDVPLGEAMAFVEKTIVAPTRGRLPPGGGYSIDLRGQAQDLTRTFDALKGTFALALIITYLLMAALFESFINPIVILFSVPLAATGGVIGLAISHAFEPTVKLDVITMLGFIILVGVVVNNAILIVHQTLNNLRAGSTFQDGLIDSVRTRIRPIFMSTTTSVFGMLPLVMAGGKGSEIYRGLGSVVVGGLALSTIFTLVLVPVVFSLFVDMRRLGEKMFGWKTLEEVTAEDRQTAESLAKLERGEG